MPLRNVCVRMVTKIGSMAKAGGYITAPNKRQRRASVVGAVLSAGM